MTVKKDSNGYEVYRYTGENSLIKDWMIDEGHCLVVVNGTIGRRLMMVLDDGHELKAASLKYKNKALKKKSVFDDENS